MDSQIVFDLRVPVGSEQVGRNIAHTLGLGLADIDGTPRRLDIVANGPSARTAVADDEFGPDVMALNGALALFTDRRPTYWCACDPQAQVADMVRDAPEGVTYIVASKCDPKVFEALADRDVRLWHIGDSAPAGHRSVPSAVSVTLCALQLAHRLGYRDIHVWGWDACFVDGQHHASGGKLKPCDVAVSFEIGEQSFQTTSTWVAELQDAIGVIPHLTWAGAEIIIHGDGMIAAGCRYVEIDQAA